MVGGWAWKLTSHIKSFMNKKMYLVAAFFLTSEYAIPHNQSSVAC